MIQLDEEQHDNCDVDSLTRQLREALSANNETTNECDKLIKQIDELEKELVVSLNLLLIITYS